MSKEAIIDKILSDARLKADAIIGEAKNKADEIIADTAEACKGYIYNSKADTDKAVLDLEARAKTVAELDARKLQLSAKAQILDRIDIVVRSGRNRVRAHRNHTGTRDFLVDLHSGEVTADTGLCALSHLDFNGSARVKITLEHAETSRSDLNNRVFAVLIEIAVQTALAGIIICTERGCCSCKALVSVLAYRAEGHCREHNRHVKLEVRCFLEMRLSVLVVGDFVL